MTNSKRMIGWILGFIFAFAVLLRTVVFVYRSEFEDDECRLICAMTDKSWWQMFLCIGNAQSAPPFYLFLERIWGSICNFNEYAVKMIPYLCSIVSLHVFWKVSGKYFKNQYSRLLGMFLIAVSQPIITYSSIAKQYTSDVLVCLLCAYFLPEINILSLDKKGMIKLLIILILLPFISLPSLFFIGAFIITNVLSGLANRKELARRLAIILIPFMVIMGLYYFFNLIPSKASLDMYFPHYWDEGFIGAHNFLAVLVINFKYAFYPNVFTLFELGLFIAGLFFFAKEKDIYGKYTLILFALILFASVFKLYPYMSRVALYSYPFLILTCVKPLDIAKFKTVWFYAICFVYLISFCGYNFSLLKTFAYRKTFINYAPRTLMVDLVDKYNSKTDVVLCNGASSASLLFYAGKVGFLPEKLEELPKPENLVEYLESLPSGQNYWFYLVKDYTQSPIFDKIMEWSMEEDIVYGKQVLDSYLFVIRR